MRKIIFVLLVLFSGCGNNLMTSDQVQHQKQEQIEKEASSQVGMPAIKNFREKRLLKEIFELRDQDGLTTYTYLFAEQTGKLVFVGESVGYGIPYSTQYTNPQKTDSEYNGRVALPQADPNALFSPASADGTWVMLLDKKSGKVRPVYFEPKVIVSQFKLKDE